MTISTCSELSCAEVGHHLDPTGKVKTSISAIRPFIYTEFLLIPCQFWLTGGGGRKLGVDTALLPPVVGGEFVYDSLERRLDKVHMC